MRLSTDKLQRRRDSVLQSRITTVGEKVVATEALLPSSKSLSPDPSGATMAANIEFLYGNQPGAGRIDSLTDIDSSDGIQFSSINGALDVDQAKAFQFDPQIPATAFNPSSTAAYTEGLQQTTVKPTALFGSAHKPSIPQNHHDSFFTEASFPAPLFTDLPNSRQQYGQVTPPDELSPKNTGANGLANDPGSDEGEQQGEDEPMETSSRDVKRRKSSVKTKETASSAKKRGRKNKVAEKEDLDPEEQAKREQFLERNRVAAHKCRQKKKEWMVNLDERCRDLQAHNKLLQAHVAELNEEVFRLKNMVFQHTDCKFAPIQAYIQHTAEQLRNRVHQNASAPDGASTGHMSMPHRHSFSGAASGIQEDYGIMGFGRSNERGATESSGASSNRSRSVSAETESFRDDWASLIQP